MRSPKKLGSAIKATLYEKRDDESLDFLAVYTRATYLTHTVTPGKYIFAVVGESADFIEVNVSGGKVYPVIIKPRMGAWKARFSAFSGCPGSTDWPQLGKWLKKSTRVTLIDEEADEWFASHGDSVRSKVENNWPKWIARENRPIIQAEDGVDNLAESLKN
jgi:hypothetical protein